MKKAKGPLQVLLGDVLVGLLAREAGGRIRFMFDEQYAEMSNRPTLSLSYEATPGELLTFAPRAYPGRLPPFFSNLLPEGLLRDLLVRRAGVRPSDEFALICALGEDLPGAVRVTEHGEALGTATTSYPASHEPDEAPLRFSLAGVQLKLSACTSMYPPLRAAAPCIPAPAGMSAILKAEGGLTVPASGVGGDCIIKLPSTTMDSIPENEFAMMTLAAKIGIPVPEVRLVTLDSVSGLPKEMLDWSGHALAVPRFDRPRGGVRIHMEDFAQVLGKFPESKYEGHSYANIAAALAATTSNGRDEAMAFVRRIVFSALIGNGDAHLKNWSVLYDDPVRPTLSPAYDLVSSLPYIPQDDLALGFGGSKRFRPFDHARVNHFARAAQLPFELVRRECLETAERTRDAWAQHEQRDVLPQQIDKVVSTHMESVLLDISASMDSRT